MKRDEGKIDDSVCRGSSGETQRVFDDLDPRFVHENLERWFQRGWEHCERILACGGDCGSSESTEQLEKYSREDEENGNSEQPKLSNSYKTSENSSNEYLNECMYLWKEPYTGGVSQFGGKRKWPTFARRKTENFDFLKRKSEFIACSGSGI